ncbi:MAG: hypothetical protein RQ856_03405 [Candidatus Izemoplasmatales bacterium]|nr:hypothetical protein [Candidatus Izemoplasmatales bacterium]
MDVLRWISEKDVFLNYLVQRDLLDINEENLENLRNKITSEGFGLSLVDKQDLKTYMWGEGVYSPKYTSTHYTLLSFCQIGANISKDRFIMAIEILLNTMWVNKGKVKPYRHQDMCVVAMMLRISCEAKINDFRITEMVDYILNHQMSDGGWNCAWERRIKPKQSSLHTTLSVIEALESYLRNGYTYQKPKIDKVIPRGFEYILSKRLFRSVSKNEVINKEILNFPFPYGWKYDILRALVVMAKLKVRYDIRMQESIELLINRLDAYGRIKADKRPVGKYHSHFTKTSKLCPYNTYRVLYILKAYKKQIYEGFIKKYFMKTYI